MTHVRTKLSAKAGLPPGSLVYVGRHKTEKPNVTLIEYTLNTFDEVSCTDIREANTVREKNSVSWINIDGIHDTEIISQLGEQFNLHPLLLEDLLNTHQRPKSEVFDNCIFLTFKMLNIGKKGEVLSEHVSFILGERFVISLQEVPGDIFDSLRQRLREGIGQMRKKKADYLFYRLLDTVVDHYFLVIDHISEDAEKLERRTFDDPTDDTLREIQQRKKQLTFLRKNIASLREAVITFPTDDNRFIRKETNRYFRDVYEHIIQVYDSIDSYREILSSIMELYLTGVSNRMNKVMQVLTIISTIFIPLTFIAGIYGMNFQNMPELEWKYGYPAVWVIMVIIVIIMIIFFRKKKWF